MDDILERPQSHSKSSGDEEQSSGDEDGALDWTKLAKHVSTRPVIPKRGEKDFEPVHGSGSDLQLHVLDRARGAMFETLRVERGISSKSASYGIWYPSIARVHVVTSRGVHFASMGHSVARASGNSGNTEPELAKTYKTETRLELLPEEAIYLIERGALFCYKSISGNPSQLNLANVEERSPGALMTVQQAYAEMIGREDMSLERYQVYAYLRRLGFVLRRAKLHISDFPVAPSHSPRLPVARAPSVWRRIATSLSLFVLKVLSVVDSLFPANPWRPFRFRGIKSSGDMFEALRILRCGHSSTLYSCRSPDEGATTISPTHSTVASSASPYSVFFHVYKPSTPFRKTAPPPPDFYLVIINARTTATPSLYELTALFEGLPEMPLPPPRKRRIQNVAQKANDTAVTSISPGPRRLSILLPHTLIQHLISYFRFKSHGAPASPFDASHNTATPKPNPFAHLKAGKKSVVIASVDSGNISFFRFGEGGFHDWPMI
ncbi:tRNA-splicing endonuclease subunit sen54 N-term-domain-containing protein [Pisolithus croceorrhizus]|nr:tRNA-splicing endonuclease subunit sen54 N-term-domain-containing protein [Pisolithus croceorrhizus]KAI6095957.1 tRNA-splicing endonuclease subunit sen54 N-term-domain-containing protein [Pisolithus croceorrhizus]